ncbi:phage tail terminator protein [Sphingobium aquiterrae]|uniref:phage tail terminator protein n=1 Tax=Sphingobium aquiterrae TaxID=2038656 RepID=UPI00301605AB
MIAIGPIVERLQAAGCKSVEGVVEFADRTIEPRALPAHFVVPTNESAAPNRMTGVVDQKITVGFTIMLAIAAGRSTGAISEALKTEGDRIKAAIVGWKHPGATGPTEYAGGQLVSTDARVIAWAFRFTCSYHLRKETQ